MTDGWTMALYGGSGSGKTTQAGEQVKIQRRANGPRPFSRLVAADMGGYESLQPLVEVGLLRVTEFGPDDDPWVFTNKVAAGEFLQPDEGLQIIDSGSSLGEGLLSACAKLAAKNIQVGSQKPLKFAIPGTGLTVGTTGESHYMVVQSFMLDAIWKSTWLSRTGINNLWTFGEHKGVDPNSEPIVGPALAGKALTGKLPKWLKYTLRMESIPVDGAAPRHVMHLQEKTELSGTGMSFANARYPLDADTPLPAMLEPASLTEFWRIIDQGHAEALAKLHAEFTG